MKFGEVYPIGFFEFPGRLVYLLDNDLSVIRDGVNGIDDYSTLYPVGFPCIYL